MDGPGDVRGARIRSTALAAWLGLMPPAEADAAFAESRRVLTDTTSALRHEIAWSDAVMAIVTRDSVRFQAAVRTMADTSRAARHIARGLRALWRERLTGAVDSLMQLTDDDMLASVNPDPVTVALSRLAIGRSLTLSGDGRRAEHYLQWTDGLVPTRRSTQVVRSIFPYTSYQRGLAAEAAGDHRAAILHLRRFVDFVDMPPPALTDQVNDAKARLARLMDRSG